MIDRVCSRTVAGAEAPGPGSRREKEGPVKSLWVLSLATLSCLVWNMAAAPENGWTAGEKPDPSGVVKLPQPRSQGDVSVEAALARRRSVRDYKKEPLGLPDVGQLLWAAQGVTHGAGLRTAPSAGALYPLELYVVSGEIEGLPPGIYKYRPASHDLARTAVGDKRSGLCSVSLNQSAVKNAPAVVVIAAVPERTTRKYWSRGTRYVHMEAGHAAENLCLQAVALDLGSVIIGAFQDDDVKRVLDLPEEEQPMLIIPVGKR